MTPKPASTGYPIILNGDHAEFEREHANTPPEQRPDWPLPSFDARDWAKFFLKVNPSCGLDESVMISWFANALMRGYDERSSRVADSLREARASGKAAGIEEAAVLIETNFFRPEPGAAAIRALVKP